MAKLTVTARAIDMLGRQQVAGVPTAIHELFKNAHDADATRVEVDYWRKDALFLLRDDGVGMSRKDFESRWLTVGTDSKLNAGSTNAPPRRGTGAPRPVLGEKGIGRLAIATIGPLVLVLTKPRPEDSLDGITVAMIHWGLFEVPGLPVDAIEIPVRTLPLGDLPNTTTIADLRQEVMQNAWAIARIDHIKADEIIADVVAEVEGFNIDLAELYAEAGEMRLDPPSASGTHFLIRPTDQIIESDIDDEKDDTASPLQRTLLGFSNTMVSINRPPTVRTAFRDHRTDGTSKDIIGDRIFFTVDDFKGADHRVEGGFDEFGQFTGNVTVYGREPIRYDLAWPDAVGHTSECGPFSLAFGYVQGSAHESKLPVEEHVRILAKLNRIGGLYLYRDGVRILPYGNSDYDFLDIERRRTKSVGRYFFSYRRMFGVIETTRERNANLVEKAGREGFKENKAYRQFKRMLENLLVRMAMDFFQRGGTYADDFIEDRAELDRAEALRKRREKKSRGAKQRLAQELDSAFEAIEANEPTKAAETLWREVEGRLIAAASDPDRNRAATAVLRIETEARQRIIELQARLSVSRPSGFGLTKTLRKDLSSYREQSLRLDREIYQPLVASVERIVGEIVAEARLPIDRRRRLEGAITPRSADARRSVGAVARQLSDAVAAISLEAARLSRLALQEVDAAIRETEAEFASTDLTALTEAGLIAFRDRLTHRVDLATEMAQGRLSSMRQRLAPIEIEGDEAVSGNEIIAALEEQIDALREEVGLNLELAQVGMALGIIQHEFQSNVSNIRSAIQAIGPWARGTKGLAKPYEELRSGFNHLDSYLGLFTPLDRRLHRRRTTFTGEQIAMFLRNLFQARLDGTGTELIATTSFLAYEVEIYPSTLLPVFANLVDNALHWIADSTLKNRRITLDVDGSDLTITDTGPGISARDAVFAFDFGFTRREGGRGLGLYIARRVLERERWKIALDLPETGRGARFRLVPPESSDSEGEGEEE